jgi:hypothetical protein
LIFFPPNFFFCSERFPFSKTPKKVLAGKKSIWQKSFFNLAKKVGLFPKNYTSDFHLHAQFTF